LGNAADPPAQGILRGEDTRKEQEMAASQLGGRLQQVKTAAQTASNFTDDQNVRTLAGAVLALADAVGILAESLERGSSG
jgi:hypothetical protein